MIQEYTLLNVADNSGAKKIRCFRILGGSRKRYARVGDIIVGTIRDALPAGTVKRSEVRKAVVVRTNREIRRTDGSLIRFSDNAAVILDDQGEPLGTRIFGPVARGGWRGQRSPHKKVCVLRGLRCVGGL